MFRNLKSNKKYFGMLSDGESSCVALATDRQFCANIESSLPAVELMKARSKQSKWNYLNKMVSPLVLLWH